MGDLNIRGRIPPPLYLSLPNTGPAGHVRGWELRQVNLNKMKTQILTAL